MRLTPHPSTPLPVGWNLAVQWHACPQRLRLAWTLRGDLAAICLPGPAAPAQRDGLWRRTCFELFVADPVGEGYREFNFSPSSEWAAYTFTGYREGMTALELPEPPQVRLDIDTSGLQLTTLLPRAAWGPALAGRAQRRRCAFAAVIERADESIAYLALAHSPGRPDFHHRDGFAVELEL
jgi:hypothetical protein